MRKSTFLWLGLAVFCATALYHTSQRVNDGRGEIARLEQNIAREEESLRVLNAEWSYLNKPARLEKLAAEHLKLVPMKARQFARFSDIDAPPPAPTPLAEKKEETIRLLPPKKTPETPKPVLRLQKPGALATSLPLPPAKEKPAPAAQSAENRGFSDVMKSLGVH